MVRDRDDQRTRWRRKKWLAMGIATLRVLRELPLLDVQLEIAGTTLERKTPLVFVGNNRYEFSLPALGARHALDAGELSLHVANCSTRWGILRLAVRGLMGRLRPTADFEVIYTAQLRVDTPRSHLTVALDGEVIRLVPPLAYCTRPAALHVLAPPPHA
jgi:diacylglycerol kinase family enzyme